MAITKEITEYTGVVPNRSQTEAEFETNVPAFLNYMDALSTDINEWTGQVNTTQDAINTSESNVNGDAITAAQSASDAEGSATTATEQAAIAVAAVASLPEGTINDTTPSLTSTYSSTKIEEKLAESAEKLSFTDSFITGQQRPYSLTVGTESPVISVYKEVPQIGESNNDWNVNADGGDYDLQMGLTVDAGAITLDSDIPNAPQSEWSFNTSKSIAAQTVAPFAVWSDSSDMYVLDAQNAKVIHYTVTDGDVSTASLVTGDEIVLSGLSPAFATAQHMYLSPDKTKIWICGTGASSTGLVHYIEMSTAGVLNSAAQIDSFSVSNAVEGYFNISSVYLTDDGSEMLISYNDSPPNRVVRKYTLSTAFQPSSSSLDSTSPETIVAKWCFLSDGLTAFSTDQDTDTIKQWEMTSSFDVTTLSELSSFSVSAQDTSPYHAFMRNDGKSIYLTGAQNDSVYQYDTVGAILSENLTAVTTLGQINTEYWLDVNSMTASEVLDSQSIHYAVSSDNRQTFQVLSASGSRNIVRNNGGTYEYNSNTDYALETWVAATANNLKSAISESMTVIQNQMTGAELAVLTDSEQVALGDTLDLSVTLLSDTSGQNPQFSGMSINYDAATLNQLAVNGVDYEFDAPELDVVRVKALVDGNFKGRVI